MERQRTATGEFEATFTDEELVDAVRENEPASTKEVGDAVGCSRQNADYRLRNLEDEGRVKSKMVGNSLVWMVVE